MGVGKMRSREGVADDRHCRVFGRAEEAAVGGLHSKDLEESFGHEVNLGELGKIANRHAHFAAPVVGELFERRGLFAHVVEVWAGDVGGFAPGFWEAGRDADDTVGVVVVERA